MPSHKLIRRGEKILKKKNPTLQWIKSISKPVIPGIIAISVAGMLNAICGVVLALQSKDVIDCAVSGNKSTLVNSAILLGILIILQFLLSFLYMKISADIVAKHTLKLQRQIFSNAVNMQYEYASKKHSGELLNRITVDADTVMCAVIGIIPQILAFVTGVVSAFVALLVIQPLFALVCAIVGVVVGIGAFAWGKRLKKYTLVCRKWSDKGNSFMLECIQNLLVIKSFANEKRVVKHAEGIQDNTYKALKKRNINNIFASLAAEFAFTFGYFLALGWGAFGLAFGTISYGNLMAMVQLVGKVQSPFKGIASVIPQYYQMLASAERLMDIVQYAEEEKTSDIKDFESIELKNVSFSYNKEETVLKDANLKIEKGDFALISGISGIGKSTLLKLLLAMYSPDDGKIVITDENGKTYNIDKACRKLFSYVPQGNMVLSGTIAENVLFFAEDADAEKVEECLKIACLWDDISEMPDGVNTIVGEHGVGLSEGQVQRLAVARAIYRDVPVLLLDEATSALDEKTERQLLHNIKSLENKTCILISHKMAAEEYMDKKIAIENGKITINN
ncbi:MAG: ABC transporter ATP-binding protein [Clostridia bacterium]|nr:ABC transporter ATP-binding protein [Clostridia bacterium]